MNHQRLPRVRLERERIVLEGLRSWEPPDHPGVPVVYVAPDLQQHVVQRECYVMPRPRWWQVRKWWQALRFFGFLP